MLYLEKIIDFAPDKDNINIVGNGYPYSKNFKDGYFALTSFADNYIACDDGKEYCWINNSNAGKYALLLEIPKGIEPKTVKNIDEKIDDDVYNSGTMRGNCISSSGSGRGGYDSSIQYKGKCQNIIYKIK